jgi:hypothetical protein
VVQETDRAGKAVARRKAGKKSVVAQAKTARTTRDRKTPTRTRR